MDRRPTTRFAVTRDGNQQAMKRSPKQVYASNRNFAISDVRAFRSKVRGMLSNRLFHRAEIVCVLTTLDDMEELLVARKTLDLAALPATPNK